MKSYLLAVLALVCTGCQTYARDPSSLLNEAEASDVVSAERRHQPADPEFYRNAYEQGVRDTLNEYKSRMRAREHYVYEPPITQRIWIPGRIVGGTFIPGHYELVIVSPGRWVAENAIPAPALGVPPASERKTNPGGQR